MKKAIILFTALLYCGFCMGQKIEGKANILWSSDIGGKSKMTLSQVVGADGTDIYVTKTTVSDDLSGNNSLPILEHYDGELALIKSGELKVNNNEGRVIYENIVQMEGNLYLFYSLVNIWNRSVTLMLQPLDKSTMRVTGIAQKVTESRIPAVSQRYQGTNFGFKRSRDGSSLLVFHAKPHERNQPEKIDLYVFDKYMDLDWSKEISLPYKQKLFEPVSFYLDNSGNVFLLGKKHFITGSVKDFGIPKYSFVLLNYFNKGMDTKNHDIPGNGKFFMDMKIGINGKSQIICSGFYANQSNSSAIGGTYYLKLEPDTYRIITETYNDFTTDFLTRNMTAKKARKAVRQLENGKKPEIFYKLDDLIIRADESVTLVGEQLEKVNIRGKSQFSQPGRGASLPQDLSAAYSASDHYAYQDILVVNFSPEGEFEWSQKIAKKQKTSSDFGFFSSYAMANVRDRMYFIFNDNPKNLNYDGSGTLANFNPKSKKDYFVAMVTLDSKGNKSKNVLAMPEDTNILIKPTVSKQISLNQLVVLGQFRTNFRLARLKFEDTFID